MGNASRRVGNEAFPVLFIAFPMGNGPFPTGNASRAWGNETERPCNEAFPVVPTAFPPGNKPFPMGNASRGWGTRHSPFLGSRSPWGTSHSLRGMLRKLRGTRPDDLVGGIPLSSPTVPCSRKPFPLGNTMPRLENKAQRLHVRHSPATARRVRRLRCLSPFCGALFTPLSLCRTLRISLNRREMKAPPGAIVISPVLQGRDPGSPKSPKPREGRQEPATAAFCRPWRGLKHRGPAFPGTEVPV